MMATLAVPKQPQGVPLWGCHKNDNTHCQLFSAPTTQLTHKLIFWPNTSTSNRPQTCYPSVTELTRTVYTITRTATTITPFFFSLSPQTLLYRWDGQGYHMLHVGLLATLARWTLFHTSLHSRLLSLHSRIPLRL